MKKRILAFLLPLLLVADMLMPMSVMARSESIENKIDDIFAWDNEILLELGGTVARNRDWYFYNDEGLVARYINTNECYQLTDFEVANINVYGDSVYFTDTEYTCAFYEEKGRGNTEYQFGGNLYRIDYIDDIPRHDIYQIGQADVAYYDLKVSKEGIFCLQRNVFGDGSDTHYSRLDNDGIEIGSLYLEQGDIIVKSIELNGYLYLEVVENTAGAYGGYILVIDRDNGTGIRKKIDGMNMHYCCDYVFYQDTHDLYLYAINPENFGAYIISYYPVAEFAMGYNYIDCIGCIEPFAYFRISRYWDACPNPYKLSKFMPVSGWLNIIGLDEREKGKEPLIDNALSDYWADTSDSICIWYPGDRGGEGTAGDNHTGGESWRVPPVPEARKPESGGESQGGGNAGQNGNAGNGQGGLVDGGHNGNAGNGQGGLVDGGHNGNTGNEQSGLADNGQNSSGDFEGSYVGGGYDDPNDIPYVNLVDEPDVMYMRDDITIEDEVSKEVDRYLYAIKHNCSLEGVYSQLTNNGTYDIQAFDQYYFGGRNTEDYLDYVMKDRLLSSLSANGFEDRHLEVMWGAMRERWSELLAQSYIESMPFDSYYLQDNIVVYEINAVMYPDFNENFDIQGASGQSWYSEAGVTPVDYAQDSLMVVAKYIAWKIDEFIFLNERPKRFNIVCAYEGGGIWRIDNGEFVGEGASSCFLPGMAEEFVPPYSGADNYIPLPELFPNDNLGSSTGNNEGSTTAPEASNPSTDGNAGSATSDNSSESGMPYEVPYVFVETPQPQRASQRPLYPLDLTKEYWKYIRKGFSSNRNDMSWEFIQRFLQDSTLAFMTINYSDSDIRVAFVNDTNMNGTKFILPKEDLNRLYDEIDRVRDAAEESGRTYYVEGLEAVREELDRQRSPIITAIKDGFRDGYNNIVDGFLAAIWPAKLRERQQERIYRENYRQNIMKDGRSALASAFTSIVYSHKF